MYLVVTLEVVALLLVATAVWFFGFGGQTRLGSWLLQRETQRRLAGAGLICRSVVLSSGATAWLHERAVAESSGPALVILPGGTSSIDFMGAQLAGLIRALSGRRVIVLELPHHGRCVTTDLDFAARGVDRSAFVEHLEQSRVALGLDEAFDLLGYSLGGGVALAYALAHPERVRRLVLVAPFVHDVATPAFAGVLQRAEWRSVHAWESLDELKHFYRNWLGMTPRSALPELVLRALHARRRATYPAGYWAAFMAASHAALEPEHRFLRDERAALEGLGRSTLLLCARDDRVCDHDKLTQLGALLGPEHCSVVSLPGGHAFAPGRGATIFTESRAAMLGFLLGLEPLAER